MSDPFSSRLLPALPVEQTELMTAPQDEDIVDTKRYWYFYFFKSEYIVIFDEISIFFL